MNAYITATAFMVTIAGYTWRLVCLIRRRGFDPTLITFANPLAMKGIAGQRIFLLAGLVFGILSPLRLAGQFVLVIVVFAYLVQMLVLYLFERGPTQPIGYYFLLILIAMLVLWRRNIDSYLVAVLLIAIQEAYLSMWHKTKQRRYNSWVVASALQINNSYKKLARNSSHEEWFWILLIATTENIARPPLVRTAERLYFKIKKPAVISTGIMQIAGPKPISDRRSMELGADLIKKVLSQMPKQLSKPQQLKWLATNYNGSSSYAIYLESTYPGVVLAWQQINPV